MDRRLSKCLFEMEEREITVPKLIRRIGEISSTLSRGLGQIRKINADQFRRQPDYFQKLVQGWSDKMLSLSKEMKVIETRLALELTSKE